MVQEGSLRIRPLFIEQCSDISCQEELDPNSSYSKLRVLFQKSYPQSKNHALFSMKPINYEQSVYISY